MLNTILSSSLSNTILECYIELSNELSAVLENHKELLACNDSFFIEFTKFNDTHNEFCALSKKRGKPDGLLLLEVIKQMTHLIDIANVAVINEASRKERELCLI
ncbi:hypothetical protein [Photorhabdus cinerea]|uniref:Uncharacterized protein n=1 Tax=Photorhabdus cinerea TaxID=471575 RepID=A0A7X5TIN3_9GAMM|nr:hypothetical protein [Photorhabdus cinerea]NHB93753.1 hypothetical protein [Photorhabdus cinerea]